MCIRDSLDVHLPVARDQLAVVAEQAQRAAAEEPLYVAEDLGPAIVGERWRIRIECRPDRTALDMDAQSLHPVLRHVEIRRHATLAKSTAFQRNALQLAVECKVPLMVRARERIDLALVLPADARAAMRAAVLEHRDVAVGLAHDDHLALADPAALVRARLGHLAVERHVVPR